jgi:hypothetical protein
MVKKVKSDSFKSPHSSNIAGARYSIRTKVLDVEFQRPPGSIYSFQDVPEKVWEGFKAHISKGTYFSEHIKGKFDFVKMQKKVGEINLESQLRASIKRAQA